MILLFFAQAFGLQLELTRVLYAALRFSRCCIDGHLALYRLRAELSECLLYIGSILSTSLEEQHVTVFFADLSSLVCSHLSLLTEINFIANDNEGEGLRTLWLRFSKEDLLPIEDVIEAGGIRHVVDQATAVSSAVEGRRK